MTPKEVWADLWERLYNAEIDLKKLALDMGPEHSARLAAKASGVSLALGYMRSYDAHVAAFDA
jgi:hypothetical protein